MPLCTVLTKWPAPSVPIQVAQGAPSKSAAIARRIGATRSQASRGPPPMIEGPWRAPSSPPETPDAEEGRADRLGLGRAASGVAEVRVAGVDDQVVGAEQRAQRRDHRVDRVAGRHHQDDRARRLQRGDEVLERRAGDEARGEVAGLGDERLRHAGRAVEDRDVGALLGDVERQRRPHRAETDQTNIRFHRATPFGTAMTSRAHVDFRADYCSSRTDGARRGGQRPGGPAAAAGRAASGAAVSKAAAISVRV